MNKVWQVGDQIVFRGVFNGQVWEALSVIVIKDSPEETVLLLRSYAQCAWSNTSRENRWVAMEALDWTLQLAEWSNNWFLIFFEPENYYAIYLIWDERQTFKGYYINFQLPFRRTELDLVVDKDFEWYLSLIHI